MTTFNLSTTVGVIIYSIYGIFKAIKGKDDLKFIFDCSVVCVDCRMQISVVPKAGDAI